MGLSKTKHRLRALQLIAERLPMWTIGSPPCVACCSRNHGQNYRKMDPAKVQQIMEEGRLRLRIMAQVYHLQLKAGQLFLHEHPAWARNWTDPILKSLLEHPAVSTETSDQCEYGGCGGRSWTNPSSQEAHSLDEQQPTSRCAAPKAVFCGPFAHPSSW